MTKRFIPFVILLLNVSLLIAQVPKSVSIKGKTGSPEVKMACADQFAGTTIRTLGASSQTNDILFLCLNDVLQVDHQNNADLSGDPDPSSIPGVGYAFFGCQPTISGPDLATILTDPCILDNPPPTGGIYVATGPLPSGDLLFTNTGILQNFFNGGNPVQIWFAPITVDSFANTSLGGIPAFESAGGGQPAGPCVNVNTADAFSVVYLNAIQESNVNYASGSLTGSFTINGGLPQYNGSNYTITITLDTNPAITGTVTSGPASNGSTVQFSVPQDGTYTITVEDGKSCGTTFQVFFPVVAFNATNETANPNDNVCVDISVLQFTNILSAQFTINYDPSVLQFTNVSGFNLDGLNASNFNLLSAGTLNFSWNSTDINNGTTLTDGASVFQICFDVIGAIGTSSPISFTGNSTPIEITNNVDLVGLSHQDGSVIVGNLSFNIDLVADSISCGETPALTDGAIHITANGGVPPYSYTWVQVGNPLNTGGGSINTLGGTADIFGLAAGTYSVTVTTSFGETQSAQVQILQAPPLFVSLNAVDPTCFGNSDGSVSINNIGGGSPGYSYIWNIGSPGATTLNNLPQGNYILTVTDARGCTRVASTSIGVNPISITNSTVNDATCAGLNDGDINIAGVTGGTSITGSYTFHWSNMTTQIGSSSALTNLTPGTYTVTIEDNNGCTLVQNFSVNADKILLVNAIVNNVNCFGGSTGVINATGSTVGGPAATPYNFSWSGGTPNNTATTSILSNLSAITYSLTMTDANGCQVDTSFAITQPDSIHITLVSLQNESCTVGNDGKITVSASGGTLNAGSSYQFSWSNSQSGTMITNLSGGSYTVTVSDDNGCTKSSVFILTSPLPPVIDSFVITNLNCPEGNDGQITVFAHAGGSPITQYAWSAPGTGNNPTIGGLIAGTYFVTITAQDGCQTVSSAAVTAPPALTLQDTTLNKPICPGYSNGSITLFISGGTPPYTYQWSGGPNQANPLFPGLSAGNYSFTIQDSKGCAPLSVVINLPNPPAIQVQFSAIDSVSCSNGTGSCDGTATATVISGNSPTGLYNFVWQSGESGLGVSNIAHNLCQGTNTLIVSDNSCADTATVFIPFPDSLGVAPNTVSNRVTCFGDCDGSASIQAIGGTPPYNYQWSTGTSGASISNVCPGNYGVLITDTKGCNYSFVLGIDEPDSLVATIDPNSTSDVNCYNESNGRITVSWTGGNDDLGGATFTWSNNVGNTQTVEGLPAGSYVVTVTDVKGCQDTAIYTIVQPLPIIAVLPTPAAPQCNGYQTTITVDTAFGGRSGAFTFTVDGSPPYIFHQEIPVFAGDHLIQIVNDGFNGITCTIDTVISIAEPPPVVVNLGPDVEIELGDSIQLIPQVPFGIDSIVWDPTDFLTFRNDLLRPYAKPVDPQLYTLTVVDVNGCTGSDDILVDVHHSRKVFIPNVFMPDGKGPQANETFTPFTGNGVRQINYMRIYDRWGELVYDKSNILAGDTNSGWDGSFRGKRMNSGVYVYLIEVEFEDGIVLLYRGSVTLIH